MMLFQTLKFRLVALGIILLIASVALRFGSALPFMQQQVQNLAAAQQLAFASYVARDVGQRLDVRRALIKRLAEDVPPSALLQPSLFKAWAAEKRDAGSWFADNLLLLDVNGNVEQHSMPVAGEHGARSFSGDEWFQEARNSVLPVLGAFTRVPGSGAPAVIIASSVRDSAQNVVAVLAGVFTLNSAGLLQSLQNNPVGKTGGLLLISPNDRLFIGSSDPAMVFTPTPDPGINPLYDRAMAGYRGAGITINTKGIEELAAIASVPDTDWFVVARMPTAEAFQPIRSLESTATKGTMLSAAAILLIILLIVSHLLRPLTSTTKAMREIADGKRELLPLPVPRNDEIGTLIRGFNYLVTRLREKESALKASETRLSFLAHHDSLTGLCNRTMLEHRMQKALDALKHDGIPFALLFCDLDGFKWINDAYGHEVGDAVLIQLAARFQQGCKPGDTVARLGGDEFVLLLTGLDDAREEAAKAARHYLSTVQEPCAVDGNVFTLSVSIGIALPTSTAIGGSQLLSQADIAMYRAKRAGKNRIIFFEEAPAATSLSA